MGLWNSQTKNWVECKKLEDLGVVLGLINEAKTENVEIPLVFDRLGGDFALRSLMEKTDRMKSLKRLKLYTGGFKLLDVDNIKLVEEFLKSLNLKEAECFVCYRESTKEAGESMTEIKRRKGGSFEIDFVLCRVD